MKDGGQSLRGLDAADLCWLEKERQGDESWVRWSSRSSGVRERERMQEQRKREKGRYAGIGLKWDLISTIHPIQRLKS